MGVVSPIGNTTETFIDNLLAGCSGVGPITLFDASNMPARIAAEVKNIPLSFRDRKIAFALEAAGQAYAASTFCSTLPQGDGGLSIGLGLELFSPEDMAVYRQSGSKLPSSLQERLTFLQTPSDLCVPLIAKRFNLTKPPLIHVSACAAGTDAIGAAFHMVRDGLWQWALAGATDSMINPLGVGGFCKLSALSTSNDRPERASRPFDQNRNGFVLGEGAGMLVLEPLAQSQARGAKIHAEIAGYGNSFDAHGISEPHPEGRGAYQAMRRALDDAGVSADEIDCVNAHGTSTPKNDPVETIAIKRLLGKRAKEVPVCATKAMIGHLISAAGAVEAIAAIGCMEKGWVHPTINLENPDPACDLDYVPQKSRPHKQRYVLSNSFGFGGQNASVLLKAFNGS
ncbi:MAG: beta-ketoacyl-[acyl-carrier-protein] synthase family protein [Elusimicrobia bacterium]|nr:beta-ketoacyl-[acyl-carrier-protein] synthase family protein [Elusimicrobiota bacterium]